MLDGVTAFRCILNSHSIVHFNDDDDDDDDALQLPGQPSSDSPGPPIGYLLQQPAAPQAKLMDIY